MKQTFIPTTHNKKIAVYENGKQGIPVLFVHGNSLGAELFSRQLKSGLAKKYHLIAFDFPGHGKSAAAVNPSQTYSPQGLIDCIFAVIYHFQLSQFILVGHSLGGHLILQSAENLSSATGFVIFGTPPLSMPPDVAKIFHPHPALGLAYKGELTDEEAKQLADAFILSSRHSDETITQLIKQTDKNFRAVFASAAFGGALKDETQIVNKIKTPLAILHGEKDQLVNLDYIKSLPIPSLWKKEVQLIRHAGHSPQWENAEAFNVLLESFIESLVKN